MAEICRVGILGGTFDPVHIGHLRIAEEALEALGLDRLVFIPAADPPHKAHKKILPFEHRWRMLSLSTGDNPRFQISDIEQTMPGKSYSVITLRELRKRSRGLEEHFFLVGMDSFLELDTWYRYRELFSLAQVVVLRRPGFDAQEVGGFLRRMVSSEYLETNEESSFRHPSLQPVHLVRNTHLGVSSTLIRHLAGQGRSIRYLVQDAVMRYIKAQKLYDDSA